MQRLQPLVSRLTRQGGRSLLQKRGYAAGEAPRSNGKGHARSPSPIAVVSCDELSCWSLIIPQFILVLLLDPVRHGCAGALADPHGEVKLNCWEAPTNIAAWKEEHIVFVVLAGWGVAIWGGMKAFGGGKKEEAPKA